MSRSKSATVIVLDVGPSMRDDWVGGEYKGETPLTASKASLISFFVQKVVEGKKNSELSLVISGTTVTSNSLASKSDGYTGIAAVHGLDLPTLDFAASIERANSGDRESDLLKALNIAFDILKMHKTKTKGKCSRHILVITAGKCHFSKEESVVSELIGSINTLDISIKFILCTEPPQSNVKQEGKTCLPSDNTIDRIYNFNDRIVQSTVTHATSRADIESGCVTAVHGTTPVYRGPLRLGTSLNIPVKCFIKVSPVKPKPLTKISKPAIEANIESSGRVKLSRIYHTQDDHDTNVEKKDRVSAYRYGKETVPFNKTDEVASKWTSEKTLTILGFVPKKSVSRHMYVSAPYTVIPDTNISAAIVGFSSLRLAMILEKKIAIVRLVKKINAHPMLGCLVPSSSNNQTTEDGCLYFLQLPMSDDMRRYHFASLLPSKTESNPNNSLFPSYEQLDVAGRLIDAMDCSNITHTVSIQNKVISAEIPSSTSTISTSTQNKTIANKLNDINNQIPVPDNAANPFLHRYATAIYNRSKEAGCPIAGDDEFSTVMVPQNALMRKCQVQINDFISKFPMKNNNLDRKGNINGFKKRKYWSDVTNSTAGIDAKTLPKDDCSKGIIQEGASSKRVKSFDDESTYGNTNVSENSLNDLTFCANVDFNNEKFLPNVGSLKPIEDFNRILQSAKSLENSKRAFELMQSAMNGMKEQIKNMVKHDVCYHEKAISCLSVMRQNVVDWSRRKCNEICRLDVKTFNSFVKTFKDNIFLSQNSSTTNGNDDAMKQIFWKLLIKHQINLISTSERSDSDVTLEEASTFLSQKQKEATDISIGQNCTIDDDEDLFDDME